LTARPVAGALRHGSRWALSFDLSSVPSAQEVKLAELRVRLPEPWRCRNVTLELYHSPREPCGQSRSCARHRLLLGTFAGGSCFAQGSWRVLDVTGALRAWLRQEAPPGLRGPQGVPAAAVPAAAVPSALDPSAEEPDLPADVTDRVLLLVFSKETSSPGACSLLRSAEASKHVLRDGGSKEPGGRRQRRNRKEKQLIKVSDVPAAAEDTRSLCRRVDMTVDFEQTGWGSWIVYPKKYNAYRCEGQCPSPVDETFKPTNHAYIQSLLRLYKPGHVPCPACAPVRMSPLSMLYYERGELVVRHHEDMVIEECGCN
ncbi:NODAL protein, partial [Nothocercus nigrocapillus]|nr:NODAL protein [Nothocercus nigrocapillus]